MIFVIIKLTSWWKGLFDPFLFLVKVTRSNTIFDRYFYFFAINPESDVQRSFPAFVDSSLHNIKNWHLLYFILFPKNDLFPENRREDLLNNSYLSRRVICWYTYKTQKATPLKRGIAIYKNTLNRDPGGIPPRVDIQNLRIGISLFFPRHAFQRIG